MGISELLAAFKDILIFAMVFATIVNWRNRPLLVLSVAALLHHLIGAWVWGIVYNLGNSSVSWNFSWIVLELPFFVFIYSKIVFTDMFKKVGLGGKCNRDMQMLFLSFLYVLFNLFEFIDWNTHNSVMMYIMPYVLPLINLLIVVVLLVDKFNFMLDKLIDGFKSIKKYFYSEVIKRIEVQ